MQGQTPRKALDAMFTPHASSRLGVIHALACQTGGVTCVLIDDVPDDVPVTERTDLRATLCLEELDF